MKIKISQLLNIEEPIGKVLSKELPFKTSYRLVRLAAQVDQELKHIERTKAEIANRFGEKTEGGYTIPKARMEDFGKAWESFIDEEIDFTAEKIPADILDLVTLSANDILKLKDFIENPQDKQKGTE